MHLFIRILVTTFVLILAPSFVNAANNDAEANDMQYDDYGSYNGSSEAVPSSPAAVSAPASSTSGGSSGGSKETVVTVTEKIPGLQCTGTDGPPEKRKFKCTIPGGFLGVMYILKGLIKYLTFIVALIWVFMIVVSGIQYSLAGASSENMKHATWRIKQVITWLVLLFLIGFILNSVAPWIYR